MLHLRLDLCKFFLNLMHLDDRLALHPLRSFLCQDTLVTVWYVCILRKRARLMLVCAHEHLFVSQIRVMFYFYEVYMQHPNASKGYVCLLWWRGSRLWDFDPILFRRFAHLDNEVMPVFLRAVHQLGLSPVVQYFLLPWHFAIYVKRVRTRVSTIWRYATDQDRVSALSSYGIPKEVVPVEMGGACKFNYSEWLATRRAQGK